jgi:hypothetical protein
MTVRLYASSSIHEILHSSPGIFCLTKAMKNKVAYELTKLNANNFAINASSYSVSVLQNKQRQSSHPNSSAKIDNFTCGSLFVSSQLQEKYRDSSESESATRLQSMSTRSSCPDLPGSSRPR